MKNHNSVLLFFIDGLGIGKRDEHNPLSQISDLSPLDVFQDETAEIIFDGVLARTDACLGIEGRPQSASGQTTILTGINAPQFLGTHKQGFPNQALREIIAEHSIFLQLKRLGIEPNVFANAYTPKFFAEPPRWKSATTCAVEAADLEYNMLGDLRARRAVFFDFTNDFLIENGVQIPRFSPEEAGEILAKLTTKNRFVLYEYFITDKIGHEQDFEKAKHYLPMLARCLRSLLRKVNFETTTVLLTSDHGNLEDLSIRNHTRNEVPTIIWGRNSREFAEKVKSLADITPTILWCLQK